MMFQSTRPRGARHAAYDVLPDLCEFQSTRPRGARLELLNQFVSLKVSIHAPAWGATSTEYRSPAPTTCFNPRARVGRDVIETGIGSLLRKFQSTRPRGARPGQKRTSPCLYPVSIHAPAWGATSRMCGSPGAGVVSIHAPAWGATLGRDACIRWRRWFQSTRPRGARHESMRTYGDCQWFQSTRPRGARLYSTYIYTVYRFRMPDPRTSQEPAKKRRIDPSLAFQISMG